MYIPSYPVNSFIVHNSPEGDWTVVEYSNKDGVVSRVYEGHSRFNDLAQDIAQFFDIGVIFAQYRTQEEYEGIWN